MICLLTGGTGFLGYFISKAISESNILVTLSRNIGQYSICLEQKVPVFFEKFDLVIHAAGKAHSVPKTSLEKQAFFDVNFKGTQNLLQGLEESQSLPRAFIFISTVAVYGKENGINISENAPLLAKDPYGLSKIQAEQLVLDWCNRNNVICTILRLPLLAGQNPPGNLGAMIKGIQKSYYFNIAGGKAKKSVVLAEDVARFIVKVAEIGGIYNLTDGCHPSFAELSNHISIQLGKGKAMNMPFWFAMIVAKFGDLLGCKAPLNTNKLKKITSDLTFDDSKAREAFGWNPTPVLEGFKLNNNV
jgi:nucleoside-diphosphate-sugar epimerase